jgi:hypothetical protein
MKIEAQNNYVTNPQFTGGVQVLSFASGSNFVSASDANPQFGFTAGGLYIGSIGNLVAKTYDGSVLTFASASGFIPGIFTAISSSSTVRNVVALR